VALSKPIIQANQKVEANMTYMKFSISQ